MKKTLLVIILLFLINSCATRKQKRVDDIHQVINSCISFYYKEREFKGGFLVYDSFFNQNNKYLKTFYKYKSNSCNDYHQIFDFEVNEDFYKNQIKNSKGKIDKAQINTKEIIFVNDLEITYNDYIKNKLKNARKELTKKDFKYYEKELLKNQLGSSIKFTKPLFSKNKNYALIFANSYAMGGEFWVLKKESEEWAVKCVLHVMSH